MGSWRAECSAAIQHPGRDPTWARTAADMGHFMIAGKQSKLNTGGKKPKQIPRRARL